MELAVAPVDQELPVAEEEVSVTDPPAQNVVGPLGVIPAVGSGSTTIFMVSEAVPQMSVTVSMYAPVALAVMEPAVSPVDHEFPVADEDVNVTEPPGQKVVGPLGVILATVEEFTVTVSEAEAVPHTLVTVKV
jgi:hypothetical protein